jgi:hypothetical protein
MIYNKLQPAWIYLLLEFPEYYQKIIPAIGGACTVTPRRRGLVGTGVALNRPKLTRPPFKHPTNIIRACQVSFDNQTSG